MTCERCRGRLLLERSVDGPPIAACVACGHRPSEPRRDAAGERGERPHRRLGPRPTSLFTVGGNATVLEGERDRLARARRRVIAPPQPPVYAYCLDDLGVLA